MPESLDEGYRQKIIDFPKTKLPQIYRLLEQYGEDKEIFRSRDDAKKFLERGKCPRFMSVWMEYDGDIR